LRIHKRQKHTYWRAELHFRINTGLEFLYPLSIYFGEKISGIVQRKEEKNEFGHWEIGVKYKLGMKKENR